MGAIWSQNDEQERRRREIEAEIRLAQIIREERTREEQRIREERFRQLLQEQRRRQADEYNTRRLEEQRRRLEEEQRQQKHINSLKLHQVSPNLDFLNSLRRAFQLPALDEYPDSTYTEELMPPGCVEFQKTRTTFRRSNKNDMFKVTKIVKINNTFLLLHFKLTREKYLQRESGVETKIMFHGTKYEFLPSICSTNFDRSKVTKHKFGHGISFARDSYYATHYHKANMRRPDKVMILVEVVYGYVQEGDTYTVIPQEPCYTSKNSVGSVLVKYDDASYYPKYVVYYAGLHPYVH